MELGRILTLSHRSPHNRPSYIFELLIRWDLDNLCSLEDDHANTAPVGEGRASNSLKVMAGVHESDVLSFRVYIQAVYKCKDLRYRFGSTQ